MMKKAIITGANGFVGSWLVKELTRHRVKITAVIKDENEDIAQLSKFKNVSIVFCDLSNLKELSSLIKERDFDAFYHLAWVSAGGFGRADYNIQLKNVKYCCDAVDVARQLECDTILFSGTISERLVNDAITTKDTIAPNEIYAICKKFAHYLSSVESAKSGLRYIWMQFANLYGPRSINGNIVGYTLKELMNGNEATFGPAEQDYDLLYIEDLVKGAFLLGNTSNVFGTYYIGSGNPQPLKNYLMEIGAICGKPELIQIGRRADDGTRYDIDWFNIDRIQKETGFKPTYSLREGIIRTKEWMREYYNY